MFFKKCCRCFAKWGSKRESVGHWLISASRWFYLPFLEGGLAVVVVAAVSACSLIFHHTFSHDTTEPLQFQGEKSRILSRQIHLSHYRGFAPWILSMWAMLVLTGVSSSLCENNLGLGYVINAMSRHLFVIMCSYHSRVTGLFDFLFLRSASVLMQCFWVQLADQ